MTNSISRLLAEELAVQEKQIVAAVALLDEGATVPFISRYRKEVTVGSAVQMRQLEERLHVTCARWKSAARPKSSAASQSRAS